MNIEYSKDKNIRFYEAYVTTLVIASILVNCAGMK